MEKVKSIDIDLSNLITEADIIAGKGILTLSIEGAERLARLILHAVAQLRQLETEVEMEA